MTVNEKDLTANQKKAANYTLTYVGNGIYSDVGKKQLWAAYIEYQPEKEQVLDEALYCEV